MSRVTNRRVAGWTLTIVLILLGFVFLWQIRDVVFIVFLSILLAAGIRPIVNFLQKRGPFNRSTGVLTVYLLIIGFIALLLYLTLPPLIREVQDLVAVFVNPNTAKEAINNLQVPFLRDVANNLYDAASNLAKNFEIDASTISLGLNVFSILFSFITVFVIAYYWINEESGVRRFILSLFARKHRSEVRNIWEEIEQKLGAWVRGQLLMMLLIGVISGIGYTVMGLPFSLGLGVFAGLTEIIPVIGPFLGGGAAMLVALTQSLPLAIIVVVFVFILQFFEGNVLVPKVMQHAVGVSSLTVIIGLLVGSTLAGIAGAAIAVPVAATIQVVVNAMLNRGSESEDQQDQANPENDSDSDKELAERQQEHKDGKVIPPASVNK
ncbi:MAG TPA: AI-2E family transporter [Chloroflexia bacterium]|nr:AI-2E family transporter [Chloroflexia bacterium]